MADEHHHETPSAPTPIGRLIDQKLREKGLRPADLVRRMGFANITEGLRVLERARMDGVVHSVGPAHLAAVLGCAERVVQRALELTKDDLAEWRRKDDREAALKRRAAAREGLVQRQVRMSRRPKLVALNETGRPTSITIAAVAWSFVDGVRKIPVPPTVLRLSEARRDEAVRELVEAHLRGRGEPLRGLWGPIVGFALIPRDAAPPLAFYDASGSRAGGPLGRYAEPLDLSICVGGKTLRDATKSPVGLP